MVVKLFFSPEWQNASHEYLKIPYTQNAFFSCLCSIKCLTSTILICIRAEFVIRELLLHSPTEEQRVCDLPPYLRLRLIPGKLDLVHHKFERQWQAKETEPPVQSKLVCTESESLSFTSSYKLT